MTASDYYLQFKTETFNLPNTKLSSGLLLCVYYTQEQPSSGALRKRFSVNINKFTEYQCRSVISINLLCKSHFGMGVLLQICYIFSKHLFLRTPLEGCNCVLYQSGLETRNQMIHKALKILKIVL